MEARSCGHRVRWTDLKASRKALFALVASMLCLCVAASVFGFAWGVNGLVRGSAVAVAAAVLVCSLTMAFGAYTTVRTWRRLHRPEGFAYWFAYLGLIVPISLLVLHSSVGEERHWTLLGLAPSLILATTLGYFRLALNSRSTCHLNPEPPPHIAIMLKDGNGTASSPATTETPAAPDRSATAFSEEDCPHFVKLGDLRPGYQVWNVAVSALYFGYLAVLAFAGLVILPRMEELTGAGIGLLLGCSALLAAVGLNFACVHELAERSRRLHKSRLKTYVPAQIGYGGTAVLILWASVGLEMSLLWIPVALAVFWSHQAWSSRLVFTDRSECRSNPELPPRIQAMLRHP